MLRAMLKGKVSSEIEGMEDVLTSNVFGVFQYLRAQDGLVPFLRRAVSPDGSGIPIGDITSGSAVSYEFWPVFEESGGRKTEPDVLLEVDCQDGKKLVLIEVKYRYGKSSPPDESGGTRDQLAREWIHLKREANDRRAQPYLVYLTADFTIPLEQIEESQSALGNSRGEIYWLSWRHLPSALEGTSHEACKHLVELIQKRLKLTFFEGLPNFDKTPDIIWQFRRTSFAWRSVVAPVAWKFNPGPY